MGEFPSKEHQWKPGQSGNPQGRPRTRYVEQELRKLFREKNNERAKIIAKTLYEYALSKDCPAHMKMLLDRVDGPVAQEAEQQQTQQPDALVLDPEDAAELKRQESEGEQT